MEGDWDYLIVLDACRYDIFKKIVDKDAGYVISGGHWTQQWLEWNFNGRYTDVVYIAGNPHLASLNLRKTFGFNPFYKVDEVWKYGWDDSLRTVPPEEVTKAACKMLDRFPEKRMIIHYNQPHAPYLTDQALNPIGRPPLHTTEQVLSIGSQPERPKNIYKIAEEGMISTKRMKKAYEKNLKLVMEEVRKLVEELHGKVILTADHGEMLGEYGVFGHNHQWLKVKEELVVPWYTIKNEKKARKRGKGEKEYQKEENIKKKVKERIRELNKKEEWINKNC